ncbi:TonB-dependent receptor [Desulfonatronum sp. SC1]|uniref:TonB-dependent receptor n=1 Tax=Desulfonatronum sp. SC1 TaxID=2109626 RepID=UPI0013049C07|nr:TonB-dependent receptor [Desulfonatronum sp. SC1]
MLRWTFSVVLAACVLGASPGAWAEDKGEVALDTIVVTAEKREENVQEVPASISVLSEFAIENAGVNSVESLSHQIPNFTFSGWGANSHNFAFMRGIGAVKHEPAVGFQVDGVGYSDLGMFNYPLFDLERIEVLRGPQGTLYGRNTLAGVVNIITKKPDNELSATLNAGAGNHGLLESSAQVNAPIVRDKLFLRVSGFAKGRDGYQENTAFGFLGKEGDHFNGRGARMRMAFLPTEDLEVSLNLDGQTQRTGAYPLRRMTPWAAAGLPADEPWTYSHNFESKAESDLWGTSLNIDWDLPFARLTSISAYRSWDNLEINDQDFSPLDITHFRKDIDSRQYSQELRLASPDDGSPFKWLGGLYLFKRDKTVDDTQFFDSQAALFGMTPGLSANTRGKFKDTSHALFGQVTRTFFDSLDFTAGLRYEHEKNILELSRGTSMSGADIRQAFTSRHESSGDALSPKFSVAWRTWEGVMPYVSAARGYRSGGFNHIAPSADKVRFNPEYSWNYELGVKSRWLEDRLLVNLAGYYITLDDQQLTFVMPEGSASTYVENAGSSTSRGVEVETMFKAFTGLDLNAGFALNKATFKTYADPTDGTDYKGKDLPLAPTYNYNLGVQYRAPSFRPISLMGREHKLNFFARADLVGMGRFYWDAANELRQSPYELVNFRVGLQSEHLDLYFWMKNAFDAEYQVVSLQRPNLPVFGQDGDPRTFGVALTLRF